MKNIFWMAGLAVAMIACNSGNNSEQATNTSSDTSNHSAHQPGGASDQGNQHTSGTDMTGKSMMSIMQANMDQMKNMQSTGNPDNDFAAMMKHHHMGSIEMAQLEIAQGTDPEVKQLAQKMLDAQQKEVAELNTFLSGHNPHGGGEAFHQEVMSQIKSMKMEMDHSGSIDRQFAQMMIPHHQSGIDMAKAYLRKGAHEEQLKAMANKIINEQQKEITELQAWLGKNK